MHMMGAGLGFFFWFLWLLVMVGFIVSWFILVYAVWRTMKNNEKILESLSGMTRAIVESHGASKDAAQHPAESAEETEEPNETDEKKV